MFVKLVSLSHSLEVEDFDAIPRYIQVDVYQLSTLHQYLTINDSARVQRCHHTQSGTCNKSIHAHHAFDLNSSTAHTRFTIALKWPLVNSNI